MKILFIIRHAKSSWEDPLLDDFSRPLNNRGKRDALAMGKRLKRKGIVPDLFLTSTARRALGTSKRIAQEIKFSESSLSLSNSLYHASVPTLYETLKEVKNKNKIVFIVGHNPGLTEFINDLLKIELNNLPTSGIVGCALHIDTWKGLSTKIGELVYYDTPKKYLGNKQQ